MRTVATSATRTTPPSRLAITMARKSSKVLTLPSERTNSVSSPEDKRPAPSLRLFISSAFCSMSRVTPRAFIATLSGITSKLRTKPPKELTSATPGKVRSAGRIVQSSSVLRSMVDRSPPSIVNMNISPSGVVMGAKPPDTPAGNSFCTLLSRSATCCRAQ